MIDFFSLEEFSPQVFPCKILFPLKLVCRIIFFIKPPSPQKSNGLSLNIPGIGIQNAIEIQKKTFSLLLEVNWSSQKTFKVRKSLVSQNSFLPPSLFFLFLCGHSLMDPWKIYINRQLKERRNGEEGWVWTSVNELVWLSHCQILVTGNNKLSV